MFIICQDYVLRTSIDPMKENGLIQKDILQKLLRIQTIPAYDLALLVNTPRQAKYLLHILEQIGSSIDSYINLDKTEFMCFKKDGAISTFNNKLLKLDHFTYFGSNISSIEN